jgi:DNA-directed RNA polymerase specialized sigma subunit
MATTPITPPTLVQSPVTATIDYKQRDIDLYNKWKETKDKRALADLMRQLHPIVYSEVRRASGTLPESALSAEAKYWTIRALETYNPARGVAVSTHVMNYLPKVRRLNYKYQNVARLPENVHLEHSTLTKAISHLEESLNREPTDEEIAKHLGWSKAFVTRFRGSLYKDLVESASERPAETSQFNTDQMLLQHILDKLDDQEKLLLMNKGTMPASELAAKLGVNVSRLNYLTAKLRDKIAAMKKQIGMF